MIVEMTQDHDIIVIQHCGGGPKTMPSLLEEATARHQRICIRGESDDAMYTGNRQRKFTVE